MSESEHIAAAPPPESSGVIDEEDRLRPEFVDKVLDAVEAGDDSTARELVKPLHPARMESEGRKSVFAALTSRSAACPLACSERSVGLC